MKLKFRLSVPVKPDSHVTAAAECALSADSWKERLAALAEQAGDAAPDNFLRELAAHPARIDRILVDDLLNRL